MVRVRSRASSAADRGLTRLHYLAYAGDTNTSAQEDREGKMPHRHRVVLVEDDADTRDSFAAFLEHSGYDVTIADNGRAALMALRTGPRPCVIMLDLAMPDMDGYTFHRTQREDPGLADIPVLVVSGGGWANEVDARKLGMTTFFRKPLDLDGFIAAVERACRPAAS